MIHLAFRAVRNGRNAGDMIPAEKRTKRGTFFLLLFSKVNKLQ